MSSSRNRSFVRWGLTVGLGLVGAGLNSFTFPILTQETPHFILGGIPVLVAYVGLGTLSGLVASVIVLAPLWFEPAMAAHPAARIGLLIYVAEAFAVFMLYRKTRSLPLAAALFWFGGGWLYTLLNYHVWMGLSFGYTAVFFVKQLLNGLLVALGAELVLGQRVRTFFGRTRGSEEVATPVEAFAFRRMVLLTLLPLTLMGIYHARTQYQDVIRLLDSENGRVAWEAVSAIDGYLTERLDALNALSRNADDADSFDTFLDRFPEFYLVALADDAGRVFRASPEQNVLGDPLVGLDVASRDYFREVSARHALTYGSLILGDLQIRSAEEIEPAIVLARPVTLDNGEFGGALLASLDPRRAAQYLELTLPSAIHRITIFDADGLVIGSNAEGRPPGTPMRSFIRDAWGGVLDPFPLQDRTTPRNLSFFPARGDDLESRIAVNLIHGSYQPVLRSGWGVLADTPAGYLHEQFVRVAFEIVAIIALTLLLLVLIVQRFARRIALPLRQAADTARRITAGGLEPAPAGHPLDRSTLDEARELGSSLEQMRAALAVKDRAVRARQRELEAQLLQAQKMEAVGLLAGGIAHDFNNMLTPIMGLADLGRSDLADGDSEGSTERSETRSYFEEIWSAAARAREVVHQLLAFSRKQVLSMGPMDLGEEVRKAGGLLRSMLRENIELTIEGAEEAHPILADPTQIHQVLVNLAVNAQDAMPEGGHLGVHLERLACGGAELAEEGLAGRPIVRLTVSDTGEGIPQSQISLIFDPFYTTKRAGEGTGLGLAMVYGIVRQHGGAIRVRSNPGSGTHFVLSFPLTENVATTRDAERIARADRHPVGGERILLVEDDDAVRRFVERVLDRNGYIVKSVRSAEEAVAHTESGSGYDLLLTDVMLSGMNGRQLYDRLAVGRPGLRALFISGYSHDVLGEDGPPEGTLFLAKPFELEDLLERVSEALRPRQPRTARDSHPAQ